MILCNGCGTRNPDDTQVCATCGRKLQSRWSMGGGPEGQGAPGAQNGQPPQNAPGVSYDLDSMGKTLEFGAPQAAPATSGPPGQAGAPGDESWQNLAPAQHTIDPHAIRLVRACAETWGYALLLVASAALSVWVQDWRPLGGGIVLAAGLAWMRGI